MPPCSTRANVKAGAETLYAEDIDDANNDGTDVDYVKSGSRSRFDMLNPGWFRI